MPRWQGQGTDTQEDVQHKSKPKLEKPPKYKVILHNDDFTTMEFVQLVLETIFHKSPATARAIMMAVHLKGRGIAGVYTYEIAEAKITKVSNLAKSQEFPLLCTMEEE
jgi:ATP-dependent Clp protease adaptor protein ClpS